MAKLYYRFWISITAVLGGVFAVLFFPVVRQRYGFEKSILFTATGVVVIWAVYFIRAYIISRMDDGRTQ